MDEPPARSAAGSNCTGWDGAGTGILRKFDLVAAARDHAGSSDFGRLKATTTNGLAHGQAVNEGIAVVNYEIEPNLTADEFIDVLVRSTLAERRPVDRRDIIEGMLSHADLILTARVDGRLVGVSRALTDFSFCTYLADLAVDEQFQGRGIGRELIRQTHAAAGLHTTLILLSAPKAQTYYPHIGLTRHESCWTIPRQA